MIRAIVGVTVLDGRGSPPVENAVIIVNDATIEAVGRRGQLEPPVGAEILRLEGMFVLPGLMDIHIHLFGRRSTNPREHVFDGEGLRAARATTHLRKLLEAGFTTVRDCGGYTALALKQAVAEGSIPGPRILAAGRFVERTGGADDPSFLPLEWTRSGGYHGPRLADGPDECRKAVREQLRDGADWIKTCSTGGAPINPASRSDVLEWSSGELHALIDEAHRLSLRVAVHAHAANGIKEAVAAGADTIEHGTCIDDEACRMMVDRGVFLIPTFFGLQQVARLGAAHGVPDVVVRESRAFQEVQQRAFEGALKHGVRLAMGTDAAGTALLPHGQNAVELALMVNAGASPQDAIIAATSNAACALGLEHQVGSVEPGKIADLIAVSDDPVRQIKTLQDVKFVMQRGTVVVNRVGTLEVKERRGAH
jgi:imidazolonepropionase-like amidohydrolase